MWSCVVRDPSGNLVGVISGAAAGERLSTRWSATTVPSAASTTMKTMTCKQLGGACDHAHRGESADDVIQAQDRHLKEMVEAGDEAHVPAREDMKRRWRRPISGMKWYKTAKADFAALPED